MHAAVSRLHWRNPTGVSRSNQRSESALLWNSDRTSWQQLFELDKPGQTILHLDRSAGHRGTFTRSFGALLLSQAIPSRSVSSLFGSLGSARSAAWASAWLVKSEQFSPSRDGTVTRAPVSGR